MVALWKDAEKRIVDKDLYSKKAEEFARLIAEDQKVSKGGKLNKRSQIRKFYDEILRLDAVSKQRPEEWVNILPLVHMVIAKTAYAEGRELVSKNFSSMMSDTINRVETPADLHVFATFFEAVMGFYRLYSKNN